MVAGPSRSDEPRCFFWRAWLELVWKKRILQGTSGTCASHINLPRKPRTCLHHGTAEPNAFGCFPQQFFFLPCPASSEGVSQSGASPTTCRLPRLPGFIQFSTLSHPMTFINRQLALSIHSGLLHTVTFSDARGSDAMLLLLSPLFNPAVSIGTSGDPGVTEQH